MVHLFVCLACVLPLQESKQTPSNQPQPKQESPKTVPQEAPKFTKSGHTVDSLELVQKRLKKKEAVLIDVREKLEWDEGHLSDAKLVPLSVVKAGKLDEQMKKSLPKDKPIYCHCRSGGRVLMFTKLLREKGYDIRPLRFGYSRLLEAGFKKAEEKAEESAPAVPSSVPSEKT